MISLILFGLLSLDTILNVPELGNAHYGIYIFDLENETVVYDTNKQKLFVPASNMKIVTTAAALHYLGPDFRFKTYLHVQGQVKEEKLYGDVFLVGCGDPTFSLENLERFVISINNLNIREITGCIYIVDDYFTDERLPVGWSWHYLDARYAPEISALSLNKNVVSVRIKPSGNDELANVSIYPATEFVQLINRMKTTAGNDSIIIFRKPEANTIYVDGAINQGNGRDIDVAVKDPGMFTGEYFKTRLIAYGIRVTRPVKRKKSSEMLIESQTILITDSILSPPLSDIINETNAESENLYAEILLKTIGVRQYKEGSFNAGLRAIREFLSLCGVDTVNLSLWDGSGLSKHNLISPSAILSVLKFMYRSTLFSTFFNSLPEPGKGTLKARFNGFSDTLRAKTGAIQASACISGYLIINGRNYAFSMLFNNFTCNSKKIQNIQDQIIRAIAEEVRINRTGNSDFYHPARTNNND